MINRQYYLYLAIPLFFFSCNEYDKVIPVPPPVVSPDLPITEPELPVDPPPPEEAEPVIPLDRIYNGIVEAEVNGDVKITNTGEKGASYYPVLPEDKEVLLKDVTLDISLESENDHTFVNIYLQDGSYWWDNIRADYYLTGKYQGKVHVEKQWMTYEEFKEAYESFNINMAYVELRGERIFRSNFILRIGDSTDSSHYLTTVSKFDVIISPTQ